jgi:reactive intermediate/imine deaminase
MSDAIHAAAAPAQAGPYSHAVRSGNLVFLSGQGPFEPDGSGIPDGFEAQARRAFQNLAIVAEAAGGSLADVVRVGVYLQTMENFAALNAIYKEFFSEPYPARTTIQSSMKIAIELDAVLELAG